MVNPRWRPEIANSRNANKTVQKDKRQQEFAFPTTEEYTGSHIKSDLGGVKVSNKSYERYYKGMV
jgi:hypothetical protein